MNDKEIVAQAALKFVKNNTIIGLGTGSTANYFIDGLAQKIKNENLDIKVVASSTTSQIKAIEAGLAYISLDQIEMIDLYVDGADEVANLDKEIVVLKGRGYDLIREKLLAYASNKFIIIGDHSKIVKKIGDNFPIPVEISPIAWRVTKRLIENNFYSGENKCVSCEIRKNVAGDGFAITSYGNLVLDCKFETSHHIDGYISDIPGVLEHGIFWGTYTALISNKGKIVAHGVGVYEDEKEAAIFASFT